MAKRLSGGVIRHSSFAHSQISKIGAPAIEGLLYALHDPDKHVRTLAVQTLGDIGNPLAVSPLVDALRDDDWVVRWTAVKALENIGTPEALAVVRKWRSLE